MASSKFDLPQGTLDLLILKTVALGPLHGYAIAQRLQQISHGWRNASWEKPKLMSPDAVNWAEI